MSASTPTFDGWDYARHWSLEGPHGGSPAVDRPCVVCGCTESRACEGGCFWIAPRLCSACACPDAPAVQSESR